MLSVVLGDVFPFTAVNPAGPRSAAAAAAAAVASECPFMFVGFELKDMFTRVETLSNEDR